MKPGRELDACIAKKVMSIINKRIPVIICPKCDSKDLRIHTLTGEDSCASCQFNLNFANKYKIAPFYSTDIAAAWEVVEKLQKEGQVITLMFSPNTKNWWSEFCPKGSSAASKESASHAICLAALKVSRASEGREE